jgi:uncharacterized damage-inducible protein DinB
MNPGTRWIDRTFEFDFPVELAPQLLERLRGTPARLEERIRSLSPEVLAQRDGERWSIQEHAGHLWDLEELFLGRLDDFEGGASALRPADMSNRKTHEAGHNRGGIEAILAAFRRERMRLVGRLESFERQDFGRSALHPRLNTPMRVCDMMFFQAEHDDHHLAHISALIQLFNRGGPARS